MRIARETAHIFKTEYNSKLLHVISLEKELKYELLHNRKQNLKLKQELKD